MDGGDGAEAQRARGGGQCGAEGAGAPMGRPARPDGRRAMGAEGERLAAEHLARLGHELLDRNWRCREGELDLVTRDGRWIVCTEVKTRASTRAGDPLEAIDARKLARLRRLAGLWRQAHPEAVGALRLDAVSVLLRPGRPRLRHVEGIGT